MVDLKTDSEKLRKAMKGWGTDDDTIVDILGNRSFEYLTKLKKAYQEYIKRDLLKDLESETKGDYRDTVLSLFDPVVDLECKALQKSMKGIGTNEDIIVEILSTCSNEEIDQIKKRYQEMYNMTLSDHIADETSGDFLTLIKEILKCQRRTVTYPDDADMQAKAKRLYEAGEGKMGTDEEVFIDVFAKSSPAEITQIARHYYKLYKKTILQSIDEEFSGDMHDLLSSIVIGQISPSEYYANRLNKAMKGIGTNDDSLIRIIVLRYEKDMADIKEYFRMLYQKDLLAEIKSETSGAYQKLLINLASRKTS